MKKGSPYPYRAQPPAPPPPPSPPRKPASGGGTNEDFHNEARRVIDQAREVVLNVVAKHDMLWDKSYAMDEELSRLFDEIIRVMEKIRNAFKIGDVATIRDLIPKAKQLADKFLKKLREAREFNQRVLPEWDSTVSEAKKKLNDIILASNLPREIRIKVYTDYTRGIDELLEPISAYGLFDSDYEIMIENYLEEIRKIEKKLSESYKKT